MIYRNILFWDHMMSGGKNTRVHMIWGKIIEGDHIIKGKIKTRIYMIWGKSIERDHIIKGKTKYCGGVKIRDKESVGYVENGRVTVSSTSRRKDSDVIEERW
jgi:hypothetical protein